MRINFNVFKEINCLFVNSVFAFFTKRAYILTLPETINIILSINVNSTDKRKFNFKGCRYNNFLK